MSTTTKSPREKILHGHVMKQDTTENGQMPKVMTTTNVIESTGPPSFGDLSGVDACSQQVNEETLGDGGVEIITPCRPSSEVQLQGRNEATDGEGDVEADPCPTHVRSIEGRMPGDDDTGDAQDGGGDHVDGPTDRLTVEGRVLGRHDGRRDQERDAGVVDAGEPFQERLLGDPVHCVPDRATDETFAGGDEEEGGDDDVGLGAPREVDASRVEVKGQGQDDEQADQVGPDVDHLVVGSPDRTQAVELGFGEAVASYDMWIDPPRMW